eukprot:467430-Amphidinium_carterae.3
MSALHPDDVVLLLCEQPHKKSTRTCAAYAHTQTHARTHTHTTRTHAQCGIMKWQNVAGAVGKVLLDNLLASTKVTTAHSALKIVMIDPAMPAQGDHHLRGRDCLMTVIVACATVATT